MANKLVELLRNALALSVLVDRDINLARRIVAAIERSQTLASPGWLGHTPETMMIQIPSSPRCARHTGVPGSSKYTGVGLDPVLQKRVQVPPAPLAVRCLQMIM